MSDRKPDSVGAGSTVYLAGLGCAVIVGACLRLYQLPSQIFIDDEWHSVRAIAASHFSYWNLLTQFDPHDNSSLPLNVYGLFLYQHVGWSEMAFHLPIVIAGILSVVILPWLLRPILGDRVSLMFAFLLAISPFLIFYSRFFRSYSFVVLLGFSALLLSYRWMTTGKTRYCIGFFVTGVLAVYMHLMALAVVFSPFAAVLGTAIMKFIEWLRTRLAKSARSKKSVKSAKPANADKSNKSIKSAKLARSENLTKSSKPAMSAKPAESPPREPIRDSIVVSFKALLTTAILIAVCLGPALYPVLQTSSGLPWAQGQFSMAGLVNAASLVCGVGGVLPTLVLLSLWIAGHFLLGKRKPALNWLFLSTLGAYAAELIVSRPTAIDEGRVVLRYAIVAAPIALTMIAIALDRLLQWPRIRRFGSIASIAAIGVLLGGLFAAGPLPVIYALPNNFTNHAVYQGFYTPMPWKYPIAMRIRACPNLGNPILQGPAPDFYSWLGAQPDIKTILEYPCDICDYNNFLFYYQHFHRKQVVVGYHANPALLGGCYIVAPDAMQNIVVAGVNIDRLFAETIYKHCLDPNKIRFQNLVNIEDENAVLHGRADVVVLHKFTVVMTLKIDGSSTCRVQWDSVDYLKGRLIKLLGPPMYEDDDVVCFRIRRSAAK